MDRNAIERRDFPIGRRGYDQTAVDEHLRRVADEFERLGAPGRSSLAAGASEQVRLILEAAERSAAELRSDAGRRAGEHVARVGEAAGGMLAKLEQLESELGDLLDGLKRSGARLSEGLAALEADEAGARIIALNMALGGSSRDETAAYLREHFELADRDALLDDVYAKVEK